LSGHGFDRGGGTALWCMFPQARLPATVVILAVALACFLAPTATLAREEPGNVECLDGLVKHLYLDTKHVLLSPVHWRQRDVMLFAALSIGTVGLMGADDDFRQIVQRNRNHSTDRVADWTNKYTRRVANSTIAGLYLTGLVFHDRKAKETALLCMESVVLSEAVTTGLKYAVGRSRPFAEKGASDFNPFKSPPPSYSLSFPSGHATTAFALSSVVAEQYHSWLVRLAAYGFALAVSYGRMDIDVHFLSDVCWGGIVGISVGRCLVKFHEKDKMPSLTLVPRTGSAGPGLGFSIRLM
jgi:membrane-associated PAP2 superfamily phosphatase